MANTNSPFGLRPLGIYGAAQPTFQLQAWKVAAGNTHAFYRGDPLIRLNTGYTDYWVNGQPASYLVGVFWGAKYLSTALGRTTQNTFWPGNDSTTDGTVYVIPCDSFPNPLFVIQANSAVTPITLANVGQNADIVLGTGSIKGGSLGISGATLGTPANTATLPFRIVGLWSDYAPAGAPGTDNTSPYNLAVVTPNTAQMTGI
jgi:hypothetical protein